jgi:hypothetical protein
MVKLMNTHFLVKKKLRLNITYFIAPLLLVLTACGGGEEQAEKKSNAAPVVNAGQDRSASEGSEVGLSASATDSDGSVSSYNWSQTSGPSVSISNRTSANASFTAPEIADGSGNISAAFTITVTDDDGESSNDTVNITIIDTVASNNPPSVDAGQDQSVPEGSEVNLSATATDSDGSILSYNWSQTSGPSVSISNRTSANATFTAPEITDGSGNISVSFNVRVTDDGGESSNDTVNITIIDTVAGNNPPSVNAGQDQSVPEGSEVELSATAADSDGSIASYSWSQISGPSVSISGANQAIASFIASQVDIDTQLIFQITVIDNNGTSNSDSITITVEDRDLGQPVVNIQSNGSEIQINWNDVNAAQYRVLYWQNGTRPLEQITTSNNLNLANLSSGTYNIIVEAYDTLGHSIFSVPVQIGV